MNTNFLLNYSCVFIQETWKQTEKSLLSPYKSSEMEIVNKQPQVS